MSADDELNRAARDYAAAQDPATKARARAQETQSRINGNALSPGRQDTR